MSLKEILYNRIKQGELSYDELTAICYEHGYKADNATRRLRELVESGVIDTIRSKKGHITGYVLKNQTVWKELAKQKKEFKQHILF